MDFRAVVATSRSSAKGKLGRNYLPCLNYQKLFTHNEQNSFSVPLSVYFSSAKCQHPL